jgi:hypothetical protein
MMRKKITTSSFERVERAYLHYPLITGAGSELLSPTSWW